MLKGIDVYHGEGRNDHYPLKSIPQKAFDDSDFVIVKASEGTSYGYQDFFKETMTAAIKAGKLIGCYHYASGADPVKEADYFLKVAKDYIGKAILCLDWEHYKNKAWGDKKWCSKFIDRVKNKTGITCVLYTGTDGIKQNASLANKVPLWFAGYPNPNYNGWVLPKFKYNLSPWTDYAIWQFTSSGEQVDRNTTRMTKEAWKTLAKGTGIPKKIITDADVRKTVVSSLEKYKGAKEGSKKHKELIKIFNDSKLCSRYKMTEKDAWCAMTFSDAFIMTKLAGKPGSGSLFQCVECSCSKMIELAKKQGIWIEDDNHVPKYGDGIVYDWQDSGKGDNKGTPDHVGLVTSCDGKIITVLEGNYKNAVGERKIKVGAKGIRGFICPDYGLYSLDDKTSGEKNKPSQNASQKATGYKGEFPTLPPRGYYKLGDGDSVYVKYKPRIKKVEKLVEWITGKKIGIDGVYGKETEQAVKDAQKILKVKQDGLFGKITLEAAKKYKK